MTRRYALITIHLIPLVSSYIYVIIFMFTTTKQQITFIIISTLLAAFSLASIVNFTDPLNSSWLTHLALYLSLFLLCLGLFTIVGLGVRQWLISKMYVINLHNSFRQALLIAILAVASFLLLANHLLFWWVELSLILFLFLVEIFLNFKS